MLGSDWTYRFSQTQRKASDGSTSQSMSELAGSSQQAEATPPTLEPTASTMTTLSTAHPDAAPVLIAPETAADECKAAAPTSILGQLPQQRRIKASHAESAAPTLDAFSEEHSPRGEEGGP